MPDIGGVLNQEVRLPLVEGPGFLGSVFVEREDEGAISIGVLKKDGQVYAYATITEDQWRNIGRLLFCDRPDLG